MTRPPLALAVLALAAAAFSLPDFCVSDSKGWVTALAAPCPPATTAFRGVGVNLFDIFWGAWGTGGPTASLATAKAGLRDAAVSGFAFARVFASPFSYEGWGWAGGAASRAAYWAAAAEVVAEAERCGIKLVPSLSYGCPDSSAPCNPAVTLFNETYREFITNASSRTRGALRAYHADFVARFKNSSAILFWELGNEMNLGECAASAALEPLARAWGWPPLRPTSGAKAHFLLLSPSPLPPPPRTPMRRLGRLHLRQVAGGLLYHGRGPGLPL
jgi:hypothetical protein